MCDHLLLFLFAKLKHEIKGETIAVPFDLLIEAFGRDTIKSCQIGIQHYFLTAIEGLRSMR